MDFQRLKRKELQALCKKHHIPANLTNLEMAKKLAFLKEKEKPMVRGRSCLKDMGETLSENGSNGVIRQFKKVRFSPENETIEFVDSSSTRRRKSITKPTTQKGGIVVNSVDSIEASREIGENRVRTTRSRAQKLVSGGVIAVLPVAQKKRKIVNATRSGSVEGDDGERGDMTNLNSDLSDHLASESADAEEIGAWASRSLRNRDVPISKKNEVEKDRILLKKNKISLKIKDVERNDKISMDTGLGGERKISQHDTSLMQSKCSVREVDDCAPLMRVSVENEVTGRDRKARSKILLVDNASAPERNMRTETKVEVHGKLEVSVQLEEPTRRSGKNGIRRKSVLPQIEEVQNDGHRKQIIQPVLEGGTRSNKLEGKDMRPRRRTRNTSVAVSDGKDWNGKHGGNNELHKRIRGPILEETVVTDGVTLGEEPSPTWSTWNAAKTATAVQRKKLQGKSKLPNLEQLEPLVERILAFQEPLILNAKLSKQEIEESAVLNSRKHHSNSATEDMNEFSEKCLSKEVSVETSAIKEVIPSGIANLVEIGASKSGKLRSDHVEIEPLVSVSSSVDEENPPQDDSSSPNENDLASHSCKRSAELESKIFVEPEEDFNEVMDLGFPQATIGADGYLLVNQTDCTALHSDKFNTSNEMERNDEPAIPECIDPSCIVAHHGIDDDKASVKEHNLLERKVGDSVGEAIEPESVVDDHSAESNERESTSVVDLSGRERIKTTNVQDRDTDEAEKSAVGAAGQEPLIGNLRTQNIEMEPLLTMSISAFKGLSVTYPRLSEFEVADGTSNPTSSIRETFSEYTNVRGHGSGSNSCLKKQHDLIEACTDSMDFDEKKGRRMVNLEETTPSSNSLKLLCDSTEQELDITASESLVVTEKENIVVVAGNQNLFQGDMQHGNTYDLVSQTQTHHGNFEVQNNIPNVGEAIEPESVVDDHSAESNERESTSVVDLSGRERIRTTNVQDRETDEAEKSAVGAAGQKPLIGNLRTQNIEMEPLLTMSISAFKSLSVTYPRLSELDVADGTSNPTLSIIEKFSEYSNVRGQGSGRNSCLKKQHDLIEACTESVDFDEKKGPMMVNLEETTPASNSVKLQCDSTWQEVDIPASESLVVTEKENILVVSGNQNLFQGDMQHENIYDLVSQTQTHHGNFEVQNNIPNVDVEETTFGPVGFSPPLQAEHVANPYCMLTFGGHFKMEKPVSGKYTQSGGVIEDDHAAEYDKCPVIEVQNIIEFQEDCRFSKQSTQEGVCEDHSTGPDGRNESTREDCEIASNIRTPAPLHKERISSNTVERNNKAEFVKHISSSNFETAKVVPEEKTDFQNTSSYCMPLNSPECEASPIGDQEIQFTRPALTIDDGAEGHANLLEVEEKSKHDNQSPLGIMIDCNTSKSYMGDKMHSSQEKSEALADNETMSDEGPLCVERASHPVDEETGYEPSEGSSTFEGHAVSSLNVLNDQPTRENENAVSEKNSIHQKIAETSTSILTNEKRILILVERDVDQIRDTLAPILPLESSLLVNKGFISSSECTPLKDDNETRQEFNTLFASPVNNASPSDEAASSHQAEMGYPSIQESLTICTVKDRRLNHGEFENFVGLRENKDKNIVYERNVSPTVSKNVSAERSDASASVEFAAVDCCSYSAFDLFTSNDGHVGDKGRDSSRYSGNASEEGRSIEVLPLIVGTGIDPFMSERESDRTEYSKEACDRQESITRFQAMGADTVCECSDDATPCTTPCDLEYESFGTSSKELSVGELRLSGDDGMQNEGMRSSPSGFVPEANTNDTSIKGDLHLECSKLATKEKDAENFPQVEVWDSKDCKDLAQVNCQSYVGLAETPCKESKVSEEKIVAEFNKSTSKSISGTKVLKEREIESFLATFDHLGNNKVVFDHGVEFATGDAGGVDDSGISSDTDAKENEILDVTNAAFDYKDKAGVLLLVENMECVMHKHDEMNHCVSNVDKDEVVAELEKSTSVALEKLVNRKEDGDLIEVLKELAGTQSQIDEVQFHDFTSHGIPLTCEPEKGSLFNPHESVSAYYEHGECNASVEVAEKIMQKASFSELNVSDNDGLVGEYHVHQCELGSDAERREATEIDEVDLFDDFGFTVSSLVPIDCNEDRGLMGCGDSDLSLESTIFSSWEINVYLGDGVRNSEISATHFTCEDSAVASLTQDNAKAILPEGQFSKHNQLKEGNVIEPNSSCFVLDEPTFEGDEVSANNSIDCSYSDKGLVEVEKSIIPICDGIVEEVSNSKGCASGDLGVEGGGFMSSEGAAAELRENAIKSNPVEFQPSEFTDLAADGGTSAEESQTWEPRSELLKGNNAVKLLNSTTIRKNSETSWIQTTPLKKLKTVDMKENEPSIKSENLSGITVRTMTKRRALDDLPNH